MKVTYLEHSGYILEDKDTVLIFDYYKGQLPDMPKEKTIYVFASHRHQDHFRKCIFDWAGRYPKIHYILSDDIKDGIEEDKKIHGLADRIIYVEPRREMLVDALQIRTLRSTDEGVAFLIRLNGKTIYHAGDLNWWHWEEEGETYNEMMRRSYQREIGRIEGEHIDVAFVPLDPRLGKSYYWGMDYFMKHTDTNCVFPMHMWGEYEVCARLMQEKDASKYQERVKMVSEAGQVFRV